MSARRFFRRTLAALVVLALLAAAAVWALNRRGEDPLPADGGAFTPTDAQVERGAYLARAGNCAACHTVRGGADHAGGLGIATPFGTVYTSNLTPDAATGIGRWTPAQFWRAMHNGRSADGRLLYPAFPYTHYTQLTRADSDALYAWLQRLPPVAQANRAHELRFPFDSQAALAVWRALFFRPGEHVDDPARPAEWNRGAYLVRGLGHCSACHAPRNVFGATRESLQFSGGLIPMQGWYAPSLADPAEAGVAHWSQDEVVALLKTGVSPRGSVLGPMADVVLRSTQHLSDADLRAMAAFLKGLPPVQRKKPAPAPAEGPALERGGKLYAQACAACHGERGEGARSADGRPAYPPLAGNRAVTMDPAVNLVRVLHNGGYPPATAGNPRPYGMPPFAQQFGDEQVADVLSYIRSAWGNAAGAVTPLQVLQARKAAQAE